LHEPLMLAKLTLMIVFAPDFEMQAGKG